MTDSNGYVEGTDGDIVAYRERLWPTLSIWLFGLLITTSVGIAYGRAYGNLIGLITATSLTLLFMFALIVTAPVIQVDDRVFRAGKARLPIEYIGKVTVLNQEATAHSIRTSGNRSAYFLVKSGIPESVIIEVTDQMDPHPYWHVSSRFANRLSEAIQDARI